MKILIVHSHNRLTGVSTFLYTLAKVLVGLGHSVTFFIKSREDDRLILEKQLESLGVRVFVHRSNIIFQENNFEQIFFNYSSDFEIFKTLKGSKRFFVHGLMERDYLPPLKGIDKVFVFGERALNFVKCNCEKVLIRNFVDTNYFKSSKILNKELKNILIFDGRQSIHTHTFILKAASKINAYVSVLGQLSHEDRLVHNTRKVIESADLVIAYGRSAIESMSMGKPTIIYGFNGGDGYVLPKNLRKFMETNLSGWSNRTLLPPYEESVDKLIEEFKKWDREDGEINRRLAVEFFSPNIYIQEILRK